MFGLGLGKHFIFKQITKINFNLKKSFSRKCEDMSGIDEACFDDDQCAQTFFK